MLNRDPGGPLSSQWSIGDGVTTSSKSIVVRARFALLAMHFAAWLSRRTGRGDGSIIGGRIALLIYPGLIAALASHLEIAVISGTNGKTTTTRLLVEALGGTDEVATSQTGSNMHAGIVTALGRRAHYSKAVLEVDEGYLPQIIAELDPAVVVLLNLSRDQLDRVGEVRMIANRWREAIGGASGVVIANADDPLVVFAASSGARVHWVGMGNPWRLDAYHCPNCNGRISYDDERWSCVCGFSRPERIPEIRGDELTLEDGRRVRLDTQLPGAFNRSNLGVAVIAARCFGVSPVDAVQKMSQVQEVAGRFARVRIGQSEARLLLAKNPAGWSSLLELARGDDSAVLIAINSRIADGFDPSWLFDVPFEQLRGRRVIACGERRFDLAVRLRHAGVDHAIGAILAIDSLFDIDASTIDVIANYTAFQDLRRGLEHPHAHGGPRRPATTRPVELKTPVSNRTERRARGNRDPLRIVVIYPDLLGTYGDTGNGLVLYNRARWREIDAELVYLNSDDELLLSGDIYVIGGGEDGPQVRAATQLREQNFRRVGDGSAVVFGVCAGYQILGNHFPGADASVHRGIGLLDVATDRSNSPRAVGELLGEVTVPAWRDRLGMLTGFENHASHTTLGAGVEALMEVRTGIGNGTSRSDGAVAGRVIGSYLHGPALARNPKLADFLLELATGVALGPLDDHEEEALREERFLRLGIAR